MKNDFAVFACYQCGEVCFYIGASHTGRVLGNADLSGGGPGGMWLCCHCWMAARSSLTSSLYDLCAHCKGRK